MIEEVKPHLCDKDCDQVEDEIIDSFLDSIIQDTNHLEGGDIQDEVNASLIE